MTDERLPHIAIQNPPMEVKEGEPLLHPTDLLCSYCGLPFEPASTTGKQAESLETGERRYFITGWSSYYEECAERIKQERNGQKDSRP